MSLPSVRVRAGWFPACRLTVDMRLWLRIRAAASEKGCQKKKRRWRCWRPPPSSSPLPPEARNSSHPHLFADHIKQRLHHPQPPPISDHFDLWRRRRKRLFFFFLLFFYFWRVIHGFPGSCFSGGWKARACGASGGSLGWCRCVSWSRLLYFCHPDFWNISLLFTFFSFFFFLFKSGLCQFSLADSPNPPHHLMSRFYAYFFVYSHWNNAQCSSPFHRFNL